MNNKRQNSWQSAVYYIPLYLHPQPDAGMQGHSDIKNIKKETNDV
jgi:hypothetical protein